jgi:predicted methyltransferase
MHGFQAKKFNCGKVVEQGVATRYTEQIAEYLAGLSDSESVSRAWEDLRDVIVNAAEAVLGTTERVKHKNWFDEECEQVTNLKNQAYKRMQQKNYTRLAVEEYSEARRKETECIKRKKGITINKN